VRASRTCLQVDIFALSLSFFGVPVAWLQALALARSYLKGTQQDLACLISSGRKADAAESAVEGAADGSEAAGAAAGGMVADPAGAAVAGPASQGPSKYAATCHRLTVLECEPSRPRALLVSAPGC
jgi:hypothetical protein